MHVKNAVNRALLNFKVSLYSNCIPCLNHLNIELIKIRSEQHFNVHNKVKDKIIIVYLNLIIILRRYHELALIKFG